MATFQEEFNSALDDRDFVRLEELSRQHNEFSVILVCERGDLALLREFIAATGIDKMSRSVIMRALESCADPLVALLATMITVRMSSADEQSLLAAVCERSFILTLGELRHRLGVSKEQVCTRDNKIFIEVCRRGDLQFARQLTEMFNFNATDVRVQNNKPLHVACMGGYSELVKWLFARFCLQREDVTSENNFAMYAACASGHLKLAEWLADTFVLTRDDISAQDNRALRIAEDNDHQEIVAWINHRCS